MSFKGDVDTESDVASVGLLCDPDTHLPSTCSEGCPLKKTVKIPRDLVEAKERIPGCARRGVRAISTDKKRKRL